MNIYECVNRLIKEECGISDEMISYAHDITERIIKGVNKCEMTIYDGIKYKTDAFKVSFLEKNMQITWYAYYFKNKDEYMKRPFILRNKSYWNFKEDKMVIYIDIINGTLDKATLSDTIYHELEHAYQTLKMGKNFGNRELYQKIGILLSSNDKFERKFGYLMYLSERSEQDALVNGLYGQYFEAEDKTILQDDFIQRSEAWKYLEFILKNYKLLDDRERVEEIIKKYNIGLTYNKIIAITNKAKEQYTRKLARVIYKINKDMRLSYNYRFNLNENRESASFFYITPFK